MLNEIAVNVSQEAEFEIYVNTSGIELDSSKLIKVATTKMLSAGYHTIKLDKPVELVGENFAVVIKQTCADDAYFMVEVPIEGTYYERVTLNDENVRVSLNGESWSNLADMGLLNYGNYMIDLAKADVCVKAFTTFNNITSSEYDISVDQYISKIHDSTPLKNVLEKITIEEGKIEVYNVNNELIMDYNTLASTGMKFKVGERVYTLVVRGDINGDGKISLVDLSKHIAHYAGLTGFTLDGAKEKAADINLDGNVTIIDVSQLLVIFNDM